MSSSMFFDVGQVESGFFVTVTVGWAGPLGVSTSSSRMERPCRMAVLE
jgi:hypothetical protein